MVQPKVVVLSPNRENIQYSVQVASIIEETFAPLVEVIRHRLTAMDHVMFLRCRLGSESTEPIGVADSSRFQLLDLFTVHTYEPVKDSVIHNFIDPDRPLRVVVAAVAFGMGIDARMFVE